MDNVFMVGIALFALAATFLPDLLPVPAEAPDAVLDAYLQGQPTTAVMRLLQGITESKRPF